MLQRCYLFPVLKTYLRFDLYVWNQFIFCFQNLIFLFFMLHFIQIIICLLLYDTASHTFCIVNSVCYCCIVYEAWGVELKLQWLVMHNWRVEVISVFELMHRSRCWCNLEWNVKLLCLFWNWNALFSEICVFTVKFEMHYLWEFCFLDLNLNEYIKVCFTFNRVQFFFAFQHFRSSDLKVKYAPSPFSFLFSFDIFVHQFWTYQMCFINVDYFFYGLLNGS